MSIKRPSDWDIGRALAAPAGSGRCRHARFQEFVIYADGEPVEKGARCMGCGVLVNRKPTSRLAEDPIQEMHRLADSLKALAERVQPLFCDCGRELSGGLCGVCDNDE